MNFDIAGLATLLSKSQEELTAALKDGDNWKDDAGKQLASMFETHLSAKLKEKSEEYQKSKDNLIKKAVKEKAEEIEKRVRDAIGITDSLEGDALIEGISSQVETLRKGASNLTDDQVKASPVYVNALKDQQKKFEAEIQKVKDEQANKEAEYQRQQVMAKVKSEASKFFDTLDIIDTASAEVKQSWRELMDVSIEKAAQYKLDEKGNIVIVDDKGEPMQTDTGKLVELKDILTRSTSHILTKAAQGRSGGGAGGDGGKGGKTAADYPKPKTKQEFLETSKAMKLAGVDPKEIQKWQGSFDLKSLQ